MSEELESIDYNNDEVLKLDDPSDEVTTESKEEITKLDSQIIEKKKRRKRKKKQKFKKIRENFAKLPPKRQVLYLTFIVLGLSLIFNILFALGVSFAPNLDVGGNSGILPLLPGNFIVEILLLWVIAVVSFFVLYPLYPYISVLFIHIHNLIKIKRFTYSRVTTGEHYFKFRKILNRVISPLLFCFVLGYWIGNWVLGTQEGIGSLIYFLYGFIATPLIVFLISPLWLLDDAGIITIKKRQEGERDVPDVEGVSAYFLNFFTGSAISLTAVTFYEIIVDLSTKTFEYDALLVFLAILFFMLPLNYLTITYLYENTMRRNKRKLHKIIPKKLVDMKPKTMVDQISFFMDITDTDEDTKDKYLNLLVEMETKADEIIGEED